MKISVFMAAFLTLGLALSGLALSESMSDMPGMAGATASQGEKVVLVGEVIDMDCYMNEGLHGEKHRACAALCLKNGSPVGLLTDDGKAYFLSADKDETKYYTLLRRMAGDRVKVSGTIQKRGGTSCLNVDKSEKLKGD
jgi:hypothetical protein